MRLENYGMYKKRNPIKNEKLLKQFRKLPCYVTKDNFQRREAHHHICKGFSNRRMDVPENLSALRWDIHTMWHTSPDQFKHLYGAETYEYLGKLKNGMTIEEIYEKYSQPDL
jgi:hypothetical protein